MAKSIQKQPVGKKTTAKKTASSDKQEATPVVKKYIRKEQRVLPIESPIEDQIKNLGAKIKKLRLDMGYTNADFFAYDHRITRSQYGRYERGEDIRFSSLLKLLQIHNLTLKEFFNEGFD